MSKQVILTGIRANNDLTLGNYFGAIMPMIDMAKNKADQYQINMFIPDLHSFTTPIDHSLLQDQILHNLRIFTAAGLPLDHKDIHIYRQSYVSAHSELTWILDCFTGFGIMNRMTQFKEKGGVQDLLSRLTARVAEDKLAVKPLEQNIPPEEAANILKKVALGSMDFQQQLLDDVNKGDTVSVGLFNYPVLMAADILLYGASYVPVGEDQTQHLEFTRDIATRLNSRFDDSLFTVPLPVKKQHEFFGKDQGLRIKDLQDPTKKMSKSDETGKGVIFLGDAPEAAAKKIMSATTDSLGKIKFDWDKQPGITNLLQILALLVEKPQDEINTAWEGKTAYGELKKAVADAVAGFLQGLQAQLAKVDDAKILSKLVDSEMQMNIEAGKTLHKVQVAVGLR